MYARGLCDDTANSEPDIEKQVGAETVRTPTLDVSENVKPVKDVHNDLLLEIHFRVDLLVHDVNNLTHSQT